MRKFYLPVKHKNSSELGKDSYLPSSQSIAGDLHVQCARMYKTTEFRWFNFISKIWPFRGFNSLLVQHNERRPGS